ncbi:MAG: sigma-54-dependent transcriptional regulator [Niabella sp.]
MAAFHIFVVEDDPWYGKILEYHLTLNPDYKVTRLLTAKDCLAHLYHKPDLITLDVNLPDMEGEKLFTKIHSTHPEIPIIIISAQENVAVAVNLLKLGAKDYLVKDDATKDLLWNSIMRIRETQGLKKEVEELKQELGQKFSFEKTLIGKSESLLKIFSLMEKAANTMINVSISGETGTGKEVVAKAIHYNSKRKNKKFVAVNMAAIPRELLESELFGHEKGAFTGAITRKTGKFEDAHGGTLFLDEIAEMDLNLQTKLLRVLQERELQRVGGNETIKLDVRLIVATHQNLTQQIEKGQFREDLYFRIIGLPIHLPPLRERGNDILMLAKYFANSAAKENNLGPITIDEGAKNKLLSYNYPGNIRELKSVIDLAAVMSNDGKITADDITFTSAKLSDDIMTKEKTLKEYENDIITLFIKKYNDIGLVAQKLDIGKSTIYKMIAKGDVKNT